MDAIWLNFMLFPWCFSGSLFWFVFNFTTCLVMGGDAVAWRCPAWCFLLLLSYHHPLCPPKKRSDAEQVEIARAELAQFIAEQRHRWAARRGLSGTAVGSHASGLRYDQCRFDSGLCRCGPWGVPFASWSLCGCGRVLWYCESVAQTAKSTQCWLANVSSCRCSALCRPGTYSGGEKKKHRTNCLWHLTLHGLPCLRTSIYMS